MALTQIPNPYVTSWPDWISTVIGFNLSLRPNISPDDPWQVVADRLTQYEVSAPRSTGFASWRDWAAALKQAYPD